MCFCEAKNSEQIPKAQTSLFDLIKNIAEVSALLGALLFLMGWSYLFGYYRGFGLSMENVGVSVYSVLVHAIPVIAACWIIDLIAVVLLILGFYFLPSIGPWLRVFPIILIVVIPLFGWGVSKYASSIGRDNATRDEYMSTTTLPFVTLQGITDRLETGCRMDESNYRLLLRSNGQVFVILPLDSENNIPMPNIRVCSFPESRVQAMRIQVGIRGR